MQKLVETDSSSLPFVPRGKIVVRTKGFRGSVFKLDPLLNVLINLYLQIFKISSIFNDNRHNLLYIILMT